MPNRLIKLIISSICFVFDKVSRILRSLFGIGTPDTLVVLSYHSVKPWQQERFADQMDQVLKAGKPVFGDMGKGPDQGVHHVAVTFDDGFKNFMDNALPAMLARRIPAIIFIPTGYVGNYPGWIKNPDHENAREILMTAEELNSLPGDMVRIGSHCVTHPRLTSLNREQIGHELSESKKHLELLLGRSVPTLACPYDDHSDEVVELARQAGYLRVFKDLPTNPMSRMDSFLSGRISASPEDWEIEYWLKLRGAYQWMSLAVEVKRYFIRN